MKTFVKNEKITNKSWGHTYKIAHISVGICLRLLNLIQNLSQDDCFQYETKCATLKQAAVEKFVILYARAFHFAIIFHFFLKFSL